MSIERLQVALTGGPGGNGVWTTYWLDAAAAQPQVLDFCAAWRNGMPDDVTLSVPDTGDVINEETGDLTSVWAGGTDGGYAGIGSAGWAAGVGMMIGWRTAGIVDGRRVNGRSFMVPLVSTVFGTNGLPLTAWVDVFLDEANDLIAHTPGNMQIWSRPKGESLGSTHSVVSATVPVTATSLRSRRV